MDYCVLVERCQWYAVFRILANGNMLNCILFCFYQEHTIIDSKPDHFLDDLRLNNPWPELKRYTALISSLIMLFWHLSTLWLRMDD